MKKFFLAFLGTLAGIWLSLFIIFVGLMLVVVAAGVSTLNGVKSVQVKSDSYLELTLVGEITDRPGQLDPVGVLRGEDNRTQGLDEIVGAIRTAANDDRIGGIVLDCRGSQLGLAGRQAVVSALRYFKSEAPSKWIYSYADIYTQGDYYIATAADSVYINPIGQVAVSGLSSTGLYFKKLLDNLGVKMQVVKVGTYKSAVEPYILDGISAPAREQQELFLTNIWTEVASQMAEGRGVSIDTVNGWANSSVYAMPTADYVKAGMVDGMMYRHEFDELIASMTGKSDVNDLTPVTPAEYCTVQNIDKKGDGRGAEIAVLYACGDITDEAGEGIVAAKIVPQILDLAEDDDIDGLVMYVNSGGGSAFASEQIWEALEQWKALTGKPFYVSMADYAASGGYYISCGADRIYARPVTLTGSIGIFGLIPDVSGLMADKIGITTSTVSTNPGGMMPTILQPMTPAQREAMQGYVDRGYELFTSRCAAGRGMSQDSIKAIAEGRVWDGAEALKLGLVDELGGLDDAVAGMAERLGASTWTIRNYPERKDKWYDILLEAGTDLKSRMVRSELGEMATIYETLARIKGMSVLQTRMEPFEINL
ncbi:MAG: signal peptide peptidase SppA [Duncaniella sp.]|nr:signal peptide peptidase SppA [Duncaniella sp.]